MNLADIVVVGVIVVAVAFVVRGMWRGSIRTCDCDSCAGNCDSCSSACAHPHMRLTRAQRRQLRQIKRRGTA